MAEVPPFLRTRAARRAAVAVAVVLALRVALPFALEAGIGWGGERALGVPVSVDNVDLAVLRGRVVLDGLAVAGPGHPPTPEDAVDAATALLRWGRLDLNLQWLELLRGRLRLSELILAGPVVRLELGDDGALVLPAPAEDEAPTEAPPAEEEPASDVEATPATEPEAEPEDGGAGWPVLVDRLELLEVQARLLDGQETPAVEMGLEALRLADISFDERGLGLGAIGLQAPSFRVRRDFVVGEDAAEAAPAPGPPTAAEPAEAAQPEGPAATYRMETLHVERAEFTLLTDAGPLDLAIEIDASGVTTEPGVRFPARIHLEIGNGLLEIAGDVGAVPPAFVGDVRWSELPLGPITLLARPDLAGWVASQRASGQLAVAFRLEAEADASAGVRLEGELVFQDLLFRDPASEDLAVAWERFTIPVDEVFVPLGEDAATKPVRVALGAVELVSPRVTFQQPNDALETLSPSAEEPAEPAPAEAPAGPAPVVSVASFTLKDGEAVFRDRSVRPAYTGRIGALAVSLRGLRLPDQTVESLSLSARLPERSKLTVQGSHGSRRSHVEADLDELALTPLNPYAVEAAGYRVDEGLASVATRADRTGGRWEVKSDLVLHRLGLSSTGTGQLDKLLGIPVNLAMALLRDLQGDIRLGIPVAFDRGRVEVGIGTILRDALRAAIAGAVTSPLKMMGATLSFASGGGLAVEPLRMAPGSTALAAGEEESLAALASLLESRPQLAVRLWGHATAEDRDGLAERILVERVAADVDLPEVEDAGFFARRRVRGALAKPVDGRAAALEPDDAALLGRYVAATPVPPERFDALARARADAIAAALASVHGVEPERVRVSDETRSEAPGVEIAFEAR